MHSTWQKNKGAKKITMKSSSISEKLSSLVGFACGFQNRRRHFFRIKVISSPQPLFE